MLGAYTARARRPDRAPCEHAREGGGVAEFSVRRYTKYP
jgi:hypothetical protein